MRWCWMLIVACWLLTAVDRSHAGHPDYLLLKTPRAAVPHEPTYGYYPGQAYEVQGRGYAYGWFGVRPRSHWVRHFGYYRSYTEWSAR